MGRSQVRLDELEPNADESADKPTRSSRSNTRNQRSERELRDRLSNCFERIANSLDARDDSDLAEIVREDADIMSQGLVSLTRPFAALRSPLLAVVAIIEPALAFGRILRTLAGRWADRRALARAESELQAEQQDPTLHQVP